MRATDFEAFYAGSYSRLSAQLYAVTGDRELARRCLDEAFAQAWSRRRSLGRDQPAEDWVRRCATRLSERWAARDRGSSPGAPAGGTGPRALVGALDGLPRAEREAVVLHRLCGLSHGDLSTELGLSTAGTQRLLDRADAVLAARTGLTPGDPGLDRLFDDWQPPAVAPTPLAEIRRRGERQHARRAATRYASAAVAVLLAVSGIVLGAGGAGWSLADLRPGPGPGPDRPELLFDPVRPRSSEIPEDFPLATGLSAPSAGDLSGPAADLPVFERAQVCGRSSSLLGQLADRLAMVLEGDGRPTVQRELVVASELDLADADLAAQGILERFVGLFKACPWEADDRRTVTTTVRASDLGDEGWTILRTTWTRPTSPSTREVLEAVRVGKAVLVTQVVSDVDGSGDEADTRAALAADVDADRGVVGLMCPWSDEGCP